MLDKIFDNIIALVTGGLLTAVIALYRARSQNIVDKSTSEMNQAMAWKTLMVQMQERVVDQQKEIDNLEQEIAERDGYIEKVIALLHRYHIETPTYVFRRRYETKEKHAE